MAYGPTTAGHAAGGTAPAAQALYSAASAIAVAALLTAARRHGRAGRAPWLALAAGQTAMMCGDLTYFALTRAYKVVPYPSLPDACYLLGYLGLAGGLLWLVRRRTPGWDLPSMIDAAVIAVSAGLVGWVYLIAPLSSGSSGAAQAVTVAYPAMDLALLALGARLMLGAGARPASFWLLAAWLAGMIVGDTTYSVQALLGIYDGTFVDGVWMTAVLFLAAAGLHPSVANIDAPSAVTAPDATIGRLGMLSVTSILAPSILAVQYARGGELHVPAVVVACVVLFLLVLARMVGLVHTQRMMAITDGLTGLRTRRYLETALRTAADHTRRSGTPFGFLLIDVDHFKQVNDTHGHQAGDRVLAEVGRRMQALCRDGDVAARYGGEEFAVLLAVNPGTLHEVAERLHCHLSCVPFAISAGQLLPVTVSIGGVCMTDSALSVQELSRIADQALYTAKDAGRNQVVLAGAATPASPDKVDLHLKIAS